MLFIEVLMVCVKKLTMKNVTNRNGTNKLLPYAFFIKDDIANNCVMERFFNNLQGS